MDTQKKSLLPLILKILVGIILIFAVVAGILLTNPKLQMKLMTTYVMKNLSGYNWSGLQMEDPIKPTLEASLGEGKESSVDELYSFMKDAAGKMRWTVTEIDTEKGTSTVEVQYVDGNDFVTAYGNELGDYIVKSIDDGSMEMKDMMNVLEKISDEDNCALLKAAREDLEDQEEQRLSTTMTIFFQQKGTLYLPTGTSDEVNDVASANLTKSMEGITKTVAIRMIPQVVERVFQAIQTFDEKELSTYTGKKLPEMLGVSEDSVLYGEISEYLKSCAAKMEYTVGDFDEETSSIGVKCTFLDSGSVMTEYLKNVAVYAVKHLLSPIPGDKENADLFRKAVENAKEERVEKVVTITFDPKDYGKFEVSDEIKDVVSANLNSRLGDLIK